MSTYVTPFTVQDMLTLSDAMVQSSLQQAHDLFPEASPGEIAQLCLLAATSCLAKNCAAQIVIAARAKSPQALPNIDPDAFTNIMGDCFKHLQDAIARLPGFPAVRATIVNEQGTIEAEEE